MPSDVEVKAGATTSFPLGRWVHQRRMALPAGEPDPHHQEMLDIHETGMLRKRGRETWEAELATSRPTGG